MDGITMHPVNLSVEERMKLLYIIATFSKRKKASKRKKITYRMFRPFSFTKEERDAIKVDGLKFSVTKNSRRWFLLNERDYKAISNIIHKKAIPELSSLRYAFKNLELTIPQNK